MKLPRPYIPLDVRLIVAGRQLPNNSPFADSICSDVYPTSKRLLCYLQHIFGNSPFHLDHNPPLCNRRFNKRTGKYKPDANDPDYLIYRKADDHRTKTFIRGDGALRSDMAQRRYLKRVAAKRKPKRKFKPRRAKHIRRIPHAPVN